MLFTNGNIFAIKLSILNDPLILIDLPIQDGD